MLKAHSSVLSVEMRRCSFPCLSPLGLNFRGIFRKTVLENTLSSFHTCPESSVTFPRSLGSPRISLRNAQRRKNCSLSWKDAPLEERKKANSGTKIGKTGGAGRGAERKKKDKRRETLGRAELSSAKAETYTRCGPAPPRAAPEASYAQTDPRRAARLAQSRAVRRRPRSPGLVICEGKDEGGNSRPETQRSEVQPHRSGPRELVPTGVPSPSHPGPTLAPATRAWPEGLQLRRTGGDEGGGWGERRI